MKKYIIATILVVASYFIPGGGIRASLCFLALFVVFFVGYYFVDRHYRHIKIHNEREKIRLKKEQQKQKEKADQIKLETSLSNMVDHIR